MLEEGLNKIMEWWRNRPPENILGSVLVNNGEMIGEWHVCFSGRRLRDHRSLFIALVVPDQDIDSSTELGRYDRK